MKTEPTPMSGEGGPAAQAQGDPSTISQPVLDGLLHGFEELGLSTYEARVLLALMRLGSANTLQIARLSKVPRTSVYHVLDGLEVKGIAERLPRQGATEWTAPQSEEVVNRLDVLQEERLRRQRARLASLRQTLAEALPKRPAAELPYVRFLRSAAHAKETFERLFSQAQAEILHVTKSPFAWSVHKPNPAVVASLEAGLPTRGLYEAPSFEDQAFRHQVETYIEAGLEARVVDELPVKLTIADRKLAMLALTGPVTSEVGYPTTLLFESAGLASLLALAFESLWATARPYEAPDEG